MANWKNRDLLLAITVLLIIIISAIVGSFFIVQNLDRLTLRVDQLEIRTQTAENNIATLKSNINGLTKKVDQLGAATVKIPHLKVKPKELY